MSDNKTAETLFEIRPWSPEWNAWLRHHRGTKTELRMLSCLSAAPARSWFAESRLPPDAPCASQLTSRTPVAAPLPIERHSVGEGELDQIAERVSAREGRVAVEMKTDRKRRKEQQRSQQIFDKAVERVAAGRNPQINGGDDLGTLDVIDPDERTALRTKIVSLRDDPVGQMAKRGHLGSAAETKIRLHAAREWQRHYERAEIGGARGIDPTREAVDGGRFEMPDTDSSLRAQQILNRLRGKLGVIGDRLTTWVLGEKCHLTKVAALLGKTARMDQVVLGHRFRECLDTIAAELGLSLDGASGPRRERDEFDQLARTGNNPALHRAIGVAKVRAPKPTESAANKGKPTLSLRSSS